MDIIDVMLARALTPQGQIESYAAQSRSAVARANSAIANIETITNQTEANNETAQETLALTNEALENAQETEARVETALQELQASNETQIQNEIDNLAFQLSRANTNALTAVGLQVSYPSGTTQNLDNITKFYKNTGNNEDGGMTQKAITDALGLKADAATAATKTYVDQKIANITIINNGSGGVSNLGSDDSGKIVIVGENGNIEAGTVDESALIEALIKQNAYSIEGAVGLIIDYTNKSFSRTQDAEGYAAGADFNSYSMYGGRMRCNVADDGTITAFYGDANYAENGSNGQVMVYQPKFYYQRLFLEEESSNGAKTIRKESLILSPKAHPGFKLHPLFRSGEEELDYVLLPAYEGGVYDVSASTYSTSDLNLLEDKLSSVAGIKPLTGAGNPITYESLLALAANRGDGWQLTNIEFESASQMLEAVEFGQLNGQLSLGKGIVNVTLGNITNGAALTGSTSSLGNASGAAASTIFDGDGTPHTYTSDGTVAISYRGVENPWGNIWRVISNLIIKGTGENNGGTPYVNNVSLGFNLPPASSQYISAMGYSSTTYDWVYLPIELSNSASSALPVGDTIWTINNLTSNNCVAIGGYYTADFTSGPFNYSCDSTTTNRLNHAGGRIMYIPTKNAIYTANIAKWQQHYGG